MHIDSYDGATWVFAFGPGVVTVSFVVLAVALFVAFLLVIIRHENHAYAQILAHEPVEPGPAVESEPPVY